MDEQQNAVYGIANWYKTLLVAVDWTAFKRLNDNAVKLHVPLELERMVRDIYSSQKRITQYYDASKELFWALQKLNVKNQSGYFTDSENVEVKLDSDPTLTTKLFLANQLRFGNNQLRATMSHSPNRSLLRKSALQYGVNNHVRVNNVMSRIDYDVMAKAFYAHYESADSQEFVVSVQFYVKPEGVFEVGATVSFQDFLEKAKGVPLVVTSAEYMRQALGYTARPSAHAVAGDYYDASYARGGAEAAGRGRGRGRGRGGAGGSGGRGAGRTNA